MLKSRVLYLLMLLMLPAAALAQSDNPRRDAEKMYQRAQGFQYEVENNTSADSLRFFRCVVDAIDYTLKSDEADRKPDKGGEVKLRHESGNKKRLVSMRPRLIDAALYLMAHNHRQDGINALRLYMKMSQSPLLTDAKEGDETTVAAFYLAQAELEARNYKAADRYADIAMDDDDIAQDAVEIKAQCMHDEMVNHSDSAKYLAVLAQLYNAEPSNETYFSWLMQFYSHENPHFNFENFIDKQLQDNPGSCIPWILKGETAMHAKRWDEAAEAYQHADDIDPKRIPVIYNIGVCLLNSAFDEQLAADDASVKNKKESKEERTKTICAQARNYFERVKAMDPHRDKVDWVTPLYQVYRILGDNIKADELQPLVKRK